MIMLVRCNHQQYLQASSNVPSFANLYFECGFFILSNSTRKVNIKSHCARWPHEDRGNIQVRMGNDLMPKNLFQNSLTYTNMKAWCQHYGHGLNNIPWLPMDGANRHIKMIGVNSNRDNLWLHPYNVLFLLDVFVDEVKLSL